MTNEKEVRSYVPIPKL